MSARDAAAREEILGRIRRSLDEPGDRRGDPVPATIPTFAGDPELTGEDHLLLFAQRCAEYRATVTRCPDASGAIARALADAVGRHGIRTVAVAPGITPEWLAGLDPAHVWRDEPPLAIERLAAAGAALTACAGAVAQTGTIVLDAGPGQGRRALTLLPDIHLCVVRGEQIVERVYESITPLAGAIAARRPVTFISGPSATSDIELRRVEGVHGPRTLEVILAG